MFHPSPSTKACLHKILPVVSYHLLLGLLTQSCTGDFPTEIMYAFLVSPTESHTQFIITFTNSNTSRLYCWVFNDFYPAYILFFVVSVLRAMT